MLRVVGSSRGTSQSSWTAEISCVHLAKLRSKTFSVSLSIAHPISFLLVEAKGGGKQHKLFTRTTEEEEIEKATASPSTAKEISVGAAVAAAMI